MFKTLSFYSFGYLQVGRVDQVPHAAVSLLKLLAANASWRMLGFASHFGYRDCSQRAFVVTNYIAEERMPHLEAASSLALWILGFMQQSIQNFLAIMIMSMMINFE